MMGVCPNQSAPDDDLVCIEKLLDALQLDVEPQMGGKTNESLKGAGWISHRAASKNSNKDNSVVTTRELCDVLGLPRAMASLSTNSDTKAWDALFDYLCEDDNNP